MACATVVLKRCGVSGDVDGSLLGQQLMDVGKGDQADAHNGRLIGLKARLPRVRLTRTACLSKGVSN